MTDTPAQDGRPGKEEKLFKLTCTGCHSCNNSHGIGQKQQCFGCCTCLPPASCLGCCECSTPFMPLSRKVGLSPTRARYLGWLALKEGVWARIWPPPPSDKVVESDKTLNYGVGANRIEIFFACDSHDDRVRDVCHEAAFQLYSHRLRYKCDCDFLHLNNSREGGGKQWRYFTDEWGEYCVTPDRVPEDARKVCDVKASPGYLVKKQMKKHDRLCKCGCFGESMPEPIAATHTTNSPSIRRNAQHTLPSLLSPKPNVNRRVRDVEAEDHILQDCMTGDIQNSRTRSHTQSSVLVSSTSKLGAPRPYIAKIPAPIIPGAHTYNQLHIAQGHTRASLEHNRLHDTFALRQHKETLPYIDSQRAQERLDEEDSEWFKIDLPRSRGA